jgi:hypothetical protein
MENIVFNFYYVFLNYFYYHITIYLGYIVECIKMLIIYLSENHPLHHSPFFTLTQNLFPFLYTSA